MDKRFWAFLMIMMVLACTYAGSNSDELGFVTTWIRIMVLVVLCTIIWLGGELFSSPKWPAIKKYLGGLYDEFFK